MKKRLIALMLASVPIVAVLTACPGPIQGGPVGNGPCATLPATISSATTLTAGCYQPVSDVDVNAALTIDPGVTILMPQNAAFNVGNNSSNVGSIHAVGTATQGIVFKGNGTQGYWADLNIYSADAANELTYVTVEDAGSPGDGGVYVGSSGSVKITHSLLQNNGGDGLYVPFSTAALPGFSSNVITGNSAGAVYIVAQLMSSLDSASSYSGNNTASDWVQVDGGSVQSGSTVTWPALDVPFFASADIEVDGNVLVQPGFLMRFGQSVALDVGNNPGNTGSLHAVGTGPDSIRFVGNGSQGYWADINFYSASASNQLTYVTVDGAGSPSDGDVYLGSNAQVRVTNSKIDDSGGWGICITDTSGTLNLDSPDSNSYTNDLLGNVNNPNNGC